MPIYEVNLTLRFRIHSANERQAEVLAEIASAVQDVDGVEFLGLKQNGATTAEVEA